MGRKKTGSFQESMYIAKRKARAFFYYLAFCACRIFPVDKKKIVMWTFECGGGYGCSPKYVAEEILKRNRDSRTDFKIIWLLDDIEKEFPGEIQKVKSTFLNRVFHLSTAGTWVSNTRAFYGTGKRKNQTYIQTWHATICIKPIGKWRGERLPHMAYLVSTYDSGLIDYVLSGSDWCSHMYRDGLIYDGEIVKTGTPRCDVLLHERKEKRIEIRQNYGMEEHARILLYAPTFRGGSQKGDRSVNTEEATVDFGRLIEAMEDRFGGIWYVLLRLHPQLAAKMDGVKVDGVSERLIDVSQHPDMNEILAGTDAFLTDYSSAIFEAAMAGMPGFIYADDLEEYVADRGDLFFDMRKLPFPVALDNDELTENIRNFDEDAYEQKRKQFMEEMGVFEDGCASERVVDLIVGSVCP